MLVRLLGLLNEASELIAFQLVFQSVVAYLMDTYLHLCASALAATIVLRSALAATFPLFTDQMFSKLGDQWGASVFAFLALLCTPLPFLFYVSYPLLHFSYLIALSQLFGSRIRAKSHFASRLAESDTEKNEAVDARELETEEHGERLV